VARGLTGSLSAAFLAVSLAACLAYQPPSGRGYDYDRGRAVARSDIGSDRYIYLVSGDQAGRLAAQGRRIEVNCGFVVRLAHPGNARDPRTLEFAQGYNSVSVPAIEQRLGAPIDELVRRCAQEGGADHAP